MQRWTVVHVRLISNIGHVMTKIDWEEPTKIKTCMYTVCWTTYERVKPATAGPVADTYLELKMLRLFYFALESEKMAIISGLQWYLKNDSIFPLFILLFFISIPNVN